MLNQISTGFAVAFQTDNPAAKRPNREDNTKNIIVDIHTPALINKKVSTNIFI